VGNSHVYELDFLAMQPTKSQLRRWDRVVQKIRELELRIKANQARSEALDISLNYGAEKGVEPPIWPMPSPLERLETLKSHWRRLSKILNGVRTEALGLQFFKDGEINVMGPPTMPPEEVQSWRAFGIAPILIKIGVVIISGIVGYVVGLITTNNKLRNDYNELLLHTDETYCKEPGSKLCKDWIARKETSGYIKKLSISEKLEEAADNIGSSIGSGFGWGIALAIPLLIFMLTRKKK
jgi:hypothetical protein